MIKFKDFLENCKVTGAVDTIGVISAQNPQGIKIDDEMNKRLNNQLSLDLTSMGCHIRPYHGYFAGHDEDAYIVINITQDDLVDLARKYSQQAVIWGHREDSNYTFYYIEYGEIKSKFKVPYNVNKINDIQSFFKSLELGTFKLPIF